MRTQEQKEANRRKNRGVMFVGFDIDLEFVPLLNKKIKESGLKKREYLQGLILRELGLRMIPRKVIPAIIIPAKVVRIEDDIVSDEDSV